MKYELETINCNYCGSDKYRIYIKDARELYNGLDGTFNVVECKECGFRFTNPRPTRDTIGYFYPDTAGYYKPEKPRQRSGLKQRFVNSILSNYYGYKLKRLPKFLDFPVYLLYRLKRKMDMFHIPMFVENGKLLDIGCSWGGYLYKMKKLGWDVYGVEINKKAAKFAVDEFGLKVKNGSIDEISFEDTFFDVINMGMVLEHLYDPTDALYKANKILKINGWLILSIPDISGFEASLYKDKAYTLQVPQHLNHFTPKTIRLFLKKTGFKAEKIVHHKSDTDIIKSASYLENKILFNAVNNKLIRKIFVKPFVKFLSLIGKTSRMTVYARKVKDSPL